MKQNRKHHTLTGAALLEALNRFELDVESIESYDTPVFRKVVQLKRAIQSLRNQVIITDGLVVARGAAATPPAKEPAHWVPANQSSPVI